MIWIQLYLYQVNLTFRPVDFFFWTPSTQTSSVPGILQYRKPKGCRIFQTPLFEKWMDPHEKFRFLLDMDFLAKEKIIFT
jgi:hypothetical protein